MQIKDVRPESFVKQIRCDRCGILSSVGEMEFDECVSIDLRGGYASVFGDGNDVQIDLCQRCVKAILGPWLRVSNPVVRQERVLKRLSLFDPDRHGGEFPAAEDVSSQESEDLPPRDRRDLSAAPDRRHHMVQARQIMRRCVKIFFVPLTGAIRGIRQEYQRLARIERARRRRQAEFVRRGKAAVERSEAACDWTPADEVVARLRAKVDVARKRKSLEPLNGESAVPPSFDDDLPSDVLQNFEGSITKDSKLTVIAGAQSDPGFAIALIDEAIELACNGKHEVARRILIDVVSTVGAGPLSSRGGGQASAEQSASPLPGAGASHRSEEQ